MSTTLTIRPAEQADAAAMVALLNAIIARGGTTAHQTPYDPERMLHDYIAAPLGISCVVALDGPRILGFQALEWADPEWQGDGKLPDDWAVIASFVAEDAQGRGVGRALWTATRAAAETAGVTAIDATIRADNALGLRFYAAMGFTDYGRIVDAPLRDGTLVDRVRKRFDLVKAGR